MLSWTNGPYVDVQDTHVTRTGGKSVACTHLTRRESSACIQHATACLRALNKRTEAVLTTYGFLNFAYFFARRQHAAARTANCDKGLKH